MSTRVLGNVKDGADITPNDTNEQRYAALYVGGAGDIKVDTDVGTTLTFVGVQAGFFPVAVSRVYSTGTTATNIIGLIT